MRTGWFIFLLVMVCSSFWIFERDVPASLVDGRYSNDASHYFTTADGSRIHYRDQGNPGGHALLLVHGSNASLHTWEPWVAELGDVYRVITLDLPGHGLTGAVPDQQYNQQAYVNVVAALARHLHISRFALGGNSMGGGVTWRYALQYPEQVQAMILVDASGPHQWRRQLARRPDSNGSPLVFRLLQYNWFRRISRYIDLNYLVEEGLRTSYFDQSLVDDALIQRYYQLNMRAGTRAATLQRFAGAGSAAEAQEDDLALSNLSVPTLIMWGADDNLVPVAIGEKFAQILPDAQLLVYPQTGHIPMEENPQQSAADVRHFLQQHLQSAQATEAR